ncbi:hypothetical protein BTS2_1838 [Bacillus sp. TS-2]|nr:hypothetical protein BTS2_1838 [Bacillus sp. TS-2]
MNNYPLYQPWSLEDIDHFFKHSLKARSISISDPDLQPFLIVDETPIKEKIGLIYGIYDEAAVNLLNGRIAHINEMEYMLLSQKQKTLFDVDTILTIGTLVILEINDKIELTGCFINRELPRLYDFITYFSGLPDFNLKYYAPSQVEEYLESVEKVKGTGLLSQIGD